MSFSSLWQQPGAHGLALSPLPPPCLRGGLGAARPGNRQVPGEGSGAGWACARGFFGGGSRQEGEGHSGGCCDSSGTVPLTIFPSPPSQELQEDDVPARRLTGAGVEDVAGARALRAALPWDR